jgi:hypothetical protein
MNEKTEFLPFHAINEYMRPDFRLTVIRETLNSQASLDEHLSGELNQRIKKYVSVPGFRSSDKAPTMVKVIPTSKAFEKNPELVAVILSCWSEIHSDLREKAYALLKARNWKVLPENEGTFSPAILAEAIKEWPIFPISMDRTKLPGFYTHWPKDEDFDTIYDQFSKLYPDISESIDKVSLMVVWLCMRLPFQVDDEIEKPKGENLTQSEG